MNQKSTAVNKTDEIWEKIIFESIEIKKKDMIGIPKALPRYC